MATFVRSSRVFFHVLKAVSLILYLPLTACSFGQSTPSKLLDALRTEQQVNHTVIGYKNGDRLEYIDTAAGNTFRRVSFPGQDGSGRSIELNAGGEIHTSSDGMWAAVCSDTFDCTVRKKDSPGKKFLISGKNALTALYWSPDDLFVLVIRKAPIWRFPLRCSLEDERDVSVYEVAQGTSGVLMTVCGGFPYGSLRWYRLNTP